MHIPDGYLSPSTCAALYAGATPFWYVALRRLRRRLDVRLVPLLALFSAFSFVVMLFNIPLPGGTTGHATGVGIAAVVLGPWGAMLALSVALLIQALFFGDGGVTAFGANAFNMAILGSGVAFVAYRLLAGGSAITSRRRALAAGAAGYLALNASALLAALEFGIQPALYHDATGAPLFAPYPLSIAVPAMMLGHLTVAGVAELLVSAGIVRWLQKAEPELLAGGVAGLAREGRGDAVGRLWLGLAALLVAAPLGLLAAGTAWGEWSPDDFADPAGRAAITAASGGIAPPESVPRGLARLSSFWTAPFPDYAPSFLKSAGFGYLMSGMLGTGLSILLGLVIGALLRRGTGSRPPGAGAETE
jgi:cobalt/nickel transport system permease protein